MLQRQPNNTFVQAQGDGVGGAHVARPTIPNPDISGLPLKMVTWNTAFYDFNNDGWEDLYIDGGALPGTESNPMRYCSITKMAPSLTCRY